METDNIVKKQAQLMGPLIKDNYNKSRNARFQNWVDKNYLQLWDLYISEQIPFSWDTFCIFAYRTSAIM